MLAYLSPTFRLPHAITTAGLAAVLLATSISTIAVAGSGNGNGNGNYGNNNGNGNSGNNNGNRNTGNNNGNGNSTDNNGNGNVGNGIGNGSSADQYSFDDKWQSSGVDELSPSLQHLMEALTKSKRLPPK
jgi:hypothetical protein